MPATSTSKASLKRKLPPTPPSQTSSSSTMTVPAARPPPKKRTKPSAKPSAVPAQPVASTSTLPPPPNPTRPLTRRRKLTAPRPLAASLPAGSAVTGPTAQIKGRSTVLVSRRTSLGNYMRRCKALILEEGISTLTLTSLSTSIPHLLTLLHALLAILPFPPSAVTYTLNTTSVRVTDEVIPDDEEEEITVEGRWVSGLECVLTIGGGGVRGGKKKDERSKTGAGRKGGAGRLGGGRKKKDAGGKKMKSKSGGKTSSAGGVEGGHEGGQEEDVGAAYVEDDEMDAMNG